MGALTEAERESLQAASLDCWNEVERTVERIAEAARIQGLRETADAWTQGGWSNVLLPKPTPPAVPVIAYANRVGDWLRDRATSEVSPGHEHGAQVAVGGVGEGDHGRSCRGDAAGGGLMTGPEHYREATSLLRQSLEYAKQTKDSGDAKRGYLAVMFAEAQAHATLALAAATVEQVAARGPGDISTEWTDVVWPVTS